MAEQYLASKNPEDPLTLAALEDLASLLPSEAAVLDLGCGAGVPVTRWLADRGFAVTGVDVSAKQLELARTDVPGGTFIKADMTEVVFEPESLRRRGRLPLHHPRATHRTSRASRRASTAGSRPGGALLATMTVADYEGRDEDWEGWGAPMVWSHYDGDTSVAMLREAGFEIGTPSPAPARHWRRARPGCGSSPEKEG